MALTEESIARTVAGMMELAGVIEARLETATDLYEARKLIAELETAQWAGTPDAIDAKRLPFVLPGSRWTARSRRESRHSPRKCGFSASPSR